jgi:hypothetical protein
MILFSKKMAKPAIPLFREMQMPAIISNLIFALNSSDRMGICNLTMLISEK